MGLKGHAEIAGAGFAGLTAAIALKQRGWSVRVHEASPQLRAFGAGIYIWENGLRVLRAIGALDDVLNGSFQGGVAESRLDGKTVSRDYFGQDCRMVTMTRQHLYTAILRAAERQGIEILVDSRVIGAGKGGQLHTADGKTYAADLVVGADGVKSSVRDSLDFKVERQAYLDGVIRLLVPWAKDDLGPGDWEHPIDFWTLHPRILRILYVPCNENDLYLCMMAPREDTEASAVPVNKDVWIKGFPELEPVIRHIGDNGKYDVYQTIKLDRWSAGKVAILGDAAHAMPPTLGQGAGCAMMNAMGLAVAVSEADSVEEGLAVWEKRERPMTDYTQNASTDLVQGRKLANGHKWTGDRLKTARHIPTGTV